MDGVSASNERGSVLPNTYRENGVSLMSLAEPITSKLCLSNDNSLEMRKRWNSSLRTKGSYQELQLADPRRIVREILADCSAENRTTKGGTVAALWETRLMEMRNLSLEIVPVSDVARPARSS